MPVNLRMPSTNVVIIAGRLTRAPVLQTAGNVPVCEFGIANGRKWRDKTTGETKEETVFVQIKCWRITAEIAGRLTKGEAVLVHGRMSEDKWVDREGKERSKTRIVADRIEQLQWPDDDARQPYASPQPVEEPPPEDDVPF